MFGRSFTVGSVRGIAIEVHPSWFIIVVLLSWSLSASVFPQLYDDWGSTLYWVVGVGAALMLFLTVLIHELAHALVAIRRGLPVPKITLFIFGGVSHLGRQPRSAGEEFAIAAAGPATSLVIAILFGLVFLVAWGRQEQFEAFFGYLALVNLLLFVFNILPGFPLDGGRVLRAIAWRRSGSFRKATKTASAVGEMFGWLLIFGGVAFFFAGLWINGLWAMLIGWFLLGSARSEGQNTRLEVILGGLTAREVMSENFTTVRPGMSLQGAVDEHMIGQGERTLVVANGERVVGLLAVSDVNRVPRSEWPYVPVQRAMTPRDQVVTVRADEPAIEVLMTLSRLGMNQIPVLDEGQLVGMVSRRELIDRVELAEELGPEPNEIEPADEPQPAGRDDR